jgi:hypothetical protein
VGSDTALRERGTSDFAVASGPKFTICGPSAYAGITGITRWIVGDGTTTNAYDAIDVVKETCEAEFQKQPGLPLRTVVARLGIALARYVEAKYPKEARSLLQRTDEQRLILTGLESGKAVIYALSVSLARAVATAVETLAGCRFLIGETGPAIALTQGRAPIPPALAQRQAVVAVRTCNNVTEDDARATFRLAVDVSHDYAFDFGLDRGVINWPIDFGFVDGDGARPIVREVSPRQP